MPEKQPDLKKASFEIINSQHVMTIASACNGIPWSAPVYYIFFEGSFYFFSKPTSRHIMDALNTKKAAASIHSESSGWADIRGLQFAGEISTSGINTSSGKAFSLYIKKFNFINDIKTTASSIKDILSLESAFKVKFYRLKPETVYYLDNSISFGFKERVIL